MNTMPTRRGFIAGGLSAGLMSSTGLAQTPATIDIGTMAAGSTWYQYGVLFSQFIKRAMPSGTVVNVRPSAAALGNLKLIQANSRIQIGLTFTTNLAWALAGMKDIQEGSASNVSAIAGHIDQYYIGMMTLAGTGLTSMSDALAAKRPLRIATLQAGSLADISTRLLLKAHGVDEAALGTWGGSIYRVSLSAAADSLADGRADIWIQPITVGHPKVQELAYSKDLRWMTLSDGAMAKLEGLGYSAADMPANSFKGQTKPVLLPGASTVLIVNSSMAEETAYLITKSLLKNIDEIRSSNAALAKFDPRISWTKKACGGAKLHPGAERAYREAGFIS